MDRGAGLPVGPPTTTTPPCTPAHACLHIATCTRVVHAGPRVGVCMPCWRVAVARWSACQNLWVPAVASQTSAPVPWLWGSDFRLQTLEVPVFRYWGSHPPVTIIAIFWCFTWTISDIYLKKILISTSSTKIETKLCWFLETYKKSCTLGTVRVRLIRSFIFIFFLQGLNVTKTIFCILPRSAIHANTKGVDST